MSNVTISTADALSFDDLTAMLNRAFSDYVVPIHLSPADLASLVERDDIRLNLSYVAYAGSAPAGAALVAVRAGREGTRTRLATMGVVPESRRSGMARALLRRVIEDARSRGSHTLLLEVFASNTRARRLYEADGFEPRRRLLGFTVHRALLRARSTQEITLRPIERDQALALFNTCAEAGDAAPPWQLDGPSLARYGAPAPLYAIETPRANGPTGYIVLGPSRPVAGLLHLGIVPAWRRRGLATAAVAAAFAAHPDVGDLYLPPLVPQASSLVPFLNAVGATPDPEEQIEMAMAL